MRSKKNWKGARARARSSRARLPHYRTPDVKSRSRYIRWCTFVYTIHTIYALQQSYDDHIKLLLLLGGDFSYACVHLSLNDFSRASSPHLMRIKYLQLRYIVYEISDVVSLLLHANVPQRYNDLYAREKINEIKLYDSYMRLYWMHKRSDSMYKYLLCSQICLNLFLFRRISGLVIKIFKIRNHL